MSVLGSGKEKDFSLFVIIWEIFVLFFILQTKMFYFINIHISESISSGVWERLLMYLWPPEKHFLKIN